MKHLQVITSAIIALGIVIAVCIASLSIRHRNDGPRVISVKGLASRDFISDLAVWSVTLNVHSYDPQSGFMTLEDDRNKLLDFLRTNGFGDQEIELQNVTYDEVRESYWDDQLSRTIYRKDGYMVTQEVTLRSNDIPKIDKVSKLIGNLIAQGLTVRSDAPSYYYTKLSDLKHEMLGEAAADARMRASQIADESNAHLGKLRKSSMGVFQILGKYSNEDYSWGGTYNTSSIEKTATITVSSEFLLK